MQHTIARHTAPKVGVIDMSPDMTAFLSPLFKELQPMGFSRASITLSEALHILLFLYGINPDRIFEFGTFYGETTRMLAANARNPNVEVFTLDIDSIDGIEFVGVDEAIAIESLENQPVFTDPRITQLKGDSLYFDPTPFKDSVQFIFIDGNHAYEYVKKDTENAFIMLDKTKPACIVWHDYENPDFPDLTEYINGVSEYKSIFHPHRPDHTTIAFYLSNCENAGK